MTKIANQQYTIDQAIKQSTETENKPCDRIEMSSSFYRGEISDIASDMIRVMNKIVDLSMRDDETKLEWPSYCSDDAVVSQPSPKIYNSSWY